jgi:hypothetical protein
MKQKILAMAAIAAVTALTSTSRANLYTDTTGDIMPSNTILDITSVDVTNTASEIVFKIKLAGNPVTTDWGKYCIGIDTNPATGDIGANGNGRVHNCSIMMASLGTTSAGPRSRKPPTPSLSLSRLPTWARPLGIRWTLMFIPPAATSIPQWMR